MSLPIEADADDLVPARPKNAVFCAVCGLGSSKDGGGALPRCGRCEVEPYCSSDCQRQAWPKHKLVCASMREKAAVARRGARTVPVDQNGNFPNSYEVSSESRAPND